MTSFWQKTRFGLLLLAWLMQLMVFLTPLLSNDLSPGHGVCIELAAVVAPPAAPAQTSHHQHMRSSSVHADQKMLLHQSSDEDDAHHLMTAAQSSNLTDHASDHSGSAHAQCGFCLLLGHSVLPPLLTVTLSDQRFVFVQYRDDVLMDQVMHVFRQRYLKPQSQAPPVFFA